MCVVIKGGGEERYDGKVKSLFLYYDIWKCLVYFFIFFGIWNF